MYVTRHFPERALSGAAGERQPARPVRTGTVIQIEQIPADTSSHNDVWRYGARSVLPLGGTGFKAVEAVPPVGVDVR